MIDMETNKMTREQVEAWRAGWQRVKRRQLAELRRMSLKTKIEKAEMLFQLAQNLKLRHAIDDPEIVAVRKRWVKLKRHYENTKST